jgi:heme-degrading monooxygenase HmoA
VRVYVSVTRTKGPPDQPRDLATIAGEEMLPWLSQIEGFDGLLMLSDEANATTLTITFWRDRDVAERHQAVRREFRDRVTATVNVTIEATEDYELSFGHLGPGLAELRS